MSAQPNRKLSATLLLLLILAIPFVLIYYLSTDFYKRRAEQWQPNNPPAATGQAYRSRVDSEQVILQKDERMDLGKTSLVFRGMENRMIQIDMYLLDLDPDESFRLKFSKKEAKKEISIGDNKYQLVSVNDRYINLKITSQFRTP